MVDGTAGTHQPFVVGEEFVHEVYQRIARQRAYRRIHRDLAEEIFYLGVEHDYRAHAVPEVVQREYALGVAPLLV